MRPARCGYIAAIASPVLLSEVIAAISASGCPSSSRSSSTCYVVCDGKMVESPFFTRLGLTGVPDNIVIKNGRIAAAHLTDNQLTEFIKEKQK